MKINKELLAYLSIAQKRYILLLLSKNVEDNNKTKKEIKKLTDYEIEKTIERVFDVYV